MDMAGISSQTYRDGIATWIWQESAVKHLGMALQHGYGMESAVKHLGMALQHGYGMESAVKHLGMALQHGYGMEVIKSPHIMCAKPSHWCWKLLL